jgi:hypothetical protein
VKNSAKGENASQTPVETLARPKPSKSATAFRTKYAVVGRRTHRPEKIIGAFFLRPRRILETRAKRKTGILHGRFGQRACENECFETGTPICGSRSLN